MNQDQTCQNAELDWHESQPFSAQYDDIYFSKESGLAETDYVFLQGNNLQQRFKTLTDDQFTIAETGFGTGLNFLSTWKLWQSSASANARLNFISVERFPLTRDDLRKALQLWPELSELADQLVEQYPAAVSGFHRLNFADDKVSLTLMFADASHAYNQLTAKVDAWFLDGFAPSKNADMWQPELFAAIAKLSRSGSTFSTFTAAGLVRRGLKAEGFDVRKIPGFGRKREMLTGTFTTPEQTTASLTPWFEYPELPEHNREAIIIGAGLAGCSTAWSLAKRGWQVTVIDQHSAPACEGSGNHQGALYAKLPARPTPSSRLHLQGFIHSINLLQQQLPEQTAIWEKCGMLQLACNEKEQLRQSALVTAKQYPHEIIHPVDSVKASEIAGQKILHDSLYIPDAGWVSPAALCQWFLQHKNIHCQFDTYIDEIEYKTDENGNSQWQLYGKERQLITASPLVIVAGAAESKRFKQLNHLPVKPIRGQVSLVGQQAEHPPLKTVICGEGYISPTLDEQWCFGASFDVKNPGTEIREADHQSNLKKLQNALPDLAKCIEELENQSLSGRVSHRCASADYLPIVGPAPDYHAFTEDFARLRKDSKWRFDCEAKHLPGLYVNLAHGSKGLITAPLAAELLADILNDSPVALEQSLQHVLNPGRFIIKNLKKGTI